MAVLAFDTGAARKGVPPLQYSVSMHSTMMTMRAQAPVAVSARPFRSSRPAPRVMSIATQMGQMARVSGTPLQKMTSARMNIGTRRRHMLVVEAAKKSVGDLQKADLEGKRVLVGPQIFTLLTVLLVECFYYFWHQPHDQHTSTKELASALSCALSCTSPGTYIHCFHAGFVSNDVSSASIVFGRALD